MKIFYLVGNFNFHRMAPHHGVGSSMYSKINAR
jgi:hypothetical protein